MLQGPSRSHDPAITPIRGDLADIALAGIHFVPHYAVPMPHVLQSAQTLRQVASADGAALRSLVAGDIFNVLDITGGWAWGQLPADGSQAGLVGYLPFSALAAAPAQ